MNIIKINNKIMKEQYSDIITEQNLHILQFYAIRTNEFKDYPYSVYVLDDEYNMTYFGDDIAEDRFAEVVER